MLRAREREKERERGVQETNCRNIKQVSGKTNGYERLTLCDKFTSMKNLYLSNRTTEKNDSVAHTIAHSDQQLTLYIYTNEKQKRNIQINL